MKSLVQRLILVGVVVLSAGAVLAHEAVLAPKKAVTTPVTALPGTGFEGRVVVDGAMIPGAKVYAYQSFSEFIASKPYAVSALTGDDGKYSLDLPGGSYYLV